jgi:methyl-accepting chemotaxis protein
MLDRMSIRTKIFGGFGAIVLLLCGMAAYSALGLGKVDSTFTEYRSAARQSLLVNEMTEGVLETRLNVFRYRIQDSPETKANVEQSVEHISELKSQAEELFGDGEIGAELQALTAKVEGYKVAFKQMSELQAQRHVFVNEMHQLGTDVRKQLSTVMDSARRDGDTEAAYLAGVTAQHLMLGRLYAEKFLLQNKPEDAARTLSELDTATKNTVELLRSLQNPQRRQLAEPAAPPACNSRTTRHRQVSRRLCTG